MDFPNNWQPISREELPMNRCNVCLLPIEKDDPKSPWTHVSPHDAMRCPSKEDFPKPVEAPQDHHPHFDRKFGSKGKVRDMSETHEFIGNDAGFWCFYEYLGCKQCGLDRSDKLHQPPPSKPVAPQEIDPAVKLLAVGKARRIVDLFEVQGESMTNQKTTPVGEVRSPKMEYLALNDSLIRQLRNIAMARARGNGLTEQHWAHDTMLGVLDRLDAALQLIAGIESALAADGVAEDALSVEKAAHEVTKKALEMAAKCSSLPVTERQKQAVDALVAGWIQAAFFAIESARSAKGETK